MVKFRIDWMNHTETKEKVYEPVLELIIAIYRGKNAGTKSTGADDRQASYQGANHDLITRRRNHK